MALLSLLKHSKSLIILTLLGAFVFGFACMSMAQHVPMYSGMNSVSSMTAPGSQHECCTTTISKQMGSLHTVFLTVVPRETRGRLFLLMMLLSFVAAFVIGRSQRKNTFSNSRLLSTAEYARGNPDLALFNHLKLAFSQGILNPKIY